MAYNHETIKSIFQDFNIDANHQSLPLTDLEKVDSKYLRDLKLNVAGLLAAKNLSKKEALTIAFAIAVNEKNDALMLAFRELLLKAEGTEADISEIHACVSIMNVNNVFYRFRHFMEGNEYYEKTPAGLRMNVMMNPVLGKQLFEMVSLVVSAVNGCERCVRSHEQSVKDQGATEPKIYDAIRLGAVIKGLSVVI